MSRRWRWPTPRNGGLKAAFRQPEAPLATVGVMQTFVVRLHVDTGADTTRLCGVIEQVTTGLRATFRSDLELVAALKAALDSGPPGDHVP